MPIKALQNNKKKTTENKTPCILLYGVIVGSEIKSFEIYVLILLILAFLCYFSGIAYFNRGETSEKYCIFR